MSADDEARRKRERPRISPETLVAHIDEHFALDGGALDVGSVVEQNSYDDRNFYATTTGPGAAAYALKVHNGVESEIPAFLECQCAMMRHLLAKGVNTPRPVRTRDGKDWSVIELPTSAMNTSSDDAGDGGEATPKPKTRAHAVRVMTWLPGIIAERSDAVPHLPAFLFRVGAFVGTVSAALTDFYHPGARRDHLWDNVNALHVRGLLRAVDDEGKRALVERALEDFEEKALRRRDAFRVGVAHNDANDNNILVADDGGGGADDASPRPVVGLLDFGDVVETWVVNEIAISAAYFALGKDDPIAAVAEMVRGYVSVFPLTGVELAATPTLVRARLACSCVCGAYSAMEDPGNAAYLLLHAGPGWETLMKLTDAGDDALLRAVDAAARRDTRVPSSIRRDE